MAKIKYLGRKKNYGPLHLAWMERPIRFVDSLSEDIDSELAESLCEYDPRLFGSTELKERKPRQVFPAFVDSTETMNVVENEDKPVEIAFETMTKEELMVFGSSLDGFTIGIRNTKQKIIEAIKKCLPAQ